jgi:excinuclease UvrABC nuclease subunit
MPVDISKTFHFHLLSILANAPHLSGVYVIFNSQRWIYVGQAGDIQARLLEQLNGTDVTATCIKSNAPTGFLFEVSAPDISVNRERQLISELHPVCNLRSG